MVFIDQQALTDHVSNWLKKENKRNRALKD
jgi:hypothetical protein